MSGERLDGVLPAGLVGRGRNRRAGEERRRVDDDRAGHRHVAVDEVPLLQVGRAVERLPVQDLELEQVDVDLVEVEVRIVVVTADRCG